MSRSTCSKFSGNSKYRSRPDRTRSWIGVRLVTTDTVITFESCLNQSLEGGVVPYEDFKFRRAMSTKGLFCITEASGVVP